MLLSLLLQLPPPPEPTVVDETSTGRIVGVIVLVLMATFVLAFLLRSTVLRPKRRRAPYGYSPAEVEDGALGARGPLAGTGSRPEATAERDSAVRERLQQIVSTDALERRRLGTRRPEAQAGTLEDTPDRVAGARRAKRGQHAPPSQRSAVPEVEPAIEPAEAPTAVEPPDMASESDTSAPTDTSARPGAVEPPADDLSTEDIEALSTPELEQPSGSDTTEHVEDTSAADGDQRLPQVEERGGEPPSAIEVDDMIATTDREGRGKVIPFPRRAPRAAPPPVPAGPISPPDAIAITATIQKLLDCANTGRVMEGFRLYTDAHLMRFITSSNMTPVEFREAASAVEPKPEAQWTRLAEVTDVERQSDGRVTATVHYKDGDELDGRERYTLIRSVSGDWLIDDIAPV